MHGEWRSGTGGVHKIYGGLGRGKTLVSADNRISKAFWGQRSTL